MYFTTAADEKSIRSLPLHKTLLCLMCVVLLVVNGVFLARNLDDLRAANALQAQTAQVSDELQYLNLIVTDAESSLRGYFLSGDEVYLGPLRSASQQIDKQMRSLDELLRDNPSQAKNLQQLRTLVDKKFGLLQQSLEVYREGGLNDIVAIAASPDDRAQMDEIRLQVVIMTREQNELLTTRTAAFYQQYRHAVVFGVGINAAAIFVLLLFYKMIKRAFRLRLLAERALQHTNDGLEEIVAERTGQLSVLSRHLIKVSEEEKSRLARELHDEMGANLTAIGMDLSTVAEHLRASHPELASKLGRAKRTLVDTVQLKRRIIENLRPSLLDNMGLSAALQSYCADYARITSLDCDALIDAEADAAGPMQAIALFRITQEALNNIAKYAKAHTVIVNLTQEPDGWGLEITDDGIGIPPDAMARSKSHGLLGMRERALLLGGTLVVERGVNGVGTCVRAMIPAAAPGGNEEAGAAQAVSAAALALSCVQAEAVLLESPPPDAAAIPVSRHLNAPHP
ncbi:CHASE3 domain-containing protein [Massilia sp. CFBP9012]|uniref:CHASE3 domain-containing protein n=1 Tax=Massilia sp. CFBP9012 TaxID=3096531 RepID=UPI002A6AA055|nr:CHASE3 domain-containing protein [Massilia sp. CFBP9012]MDY0973621.1 CHASE3 domain-containing protein [Massilia sp. CFBP9012]